MIRARGLWENRRNADSFWAFSCHCPVPESLLMFQARFGAGLHKRHRFIFVACSPFVPLRLPCIFDPILPFCCILFGIMVLSYFLVMPFQQSHCRLADDGLGQSLFTCSINCPRKTLNVSGPAGFHTHLIDDVYGLSFMPIWHRWK